MKTWGYLSGRMGTIEAHVSGKALAVAGLSFTCSAVVEIAIKFTQWWTAMIVLAFGLTFMLVGFIYARRMGDQEKRDAEAKEKAKEDAEYKQRNLDAVEAKVQKDKERTEQDKAVEAEQVKEYQRELARGGGTNPLSAPYRHLLFI
jgi:flagellar biosynthesis/type III secretory pathway M-ring protein FliF/YscJ